MLKLHANSHFSAKRFIHLFILLSTVFFLSSCATQLPWEASSNTGIITQDPEKLPDIGWQTTQQRKNLARENERIMQELESLRQELYAQQNKQREGIDRYAKENNLDLSKKQNRHKENPDVDVYPYEQETRPSIEVQSGYSYDYGHNRENAPSSNTHPNGTRNPYTSNPYNVEQAALLPEKTLQAATIPRSKKMTVSLLLPLTGAKASLGTSMLQAAQMALFDIGSADFELVPRDTKSTTSGAIEAAQAAVNAQTDLILGPIFSHDLKAIKPITGPANIPVISFTTDWSLADTNTYIMGFLPFAQVTRIAKYTQNQGYTRFAVFAPKTPYCDAVIRTLKNTDVSIAHVDYYAAQQPDLASIAKDFIETSADPFSHNALDFDALLLPIGGEGLRSLVSYLDTYELDQTKVKFIGTGLWDDPRLTKNPILFGGWFAAPDPSLRQDFENRYKQNFNRKPLRLASLAYDATALAAVLARSAPTSGSPYTYKALTNPRGFAGIDGIFRFRSDGLSERGLAVLEVKSGQIKVVDPAPTAFTPAPY